MKKLLGLAITLIMAVVLFTFATVSVSAETTKSYVVGDADMDGVITIKDATLIQLNVSKLETLTTKQQIFADCDDKANIQITDAV